MSVDGLCMFKKIADKHPELHPDNSKDVFFAAECYVCKGHKQSCSYYKSIHTEEFSVKYKKNYSVSAL